MPIAAMPGNTTAASACWSGGWPTGNTSWATYSIADIISFPWVLIAKPLGQSLDEFPNVSRWRAAIKERPAVQRGVDVGKDLRRSGPHTEAARKLLFGQTAKSLPA